MPSSSEKQHKFMQAIAHDKDFAAKAGVDQSVGQDFENADKKSSKYKLGKLYGGKKKK